jgi:2-amino-4-hydroxy-6-hydroxymethyldihydropteridine diphosphokinase
VTTLTSTSCYVAVGSNLGERLAWCKTAVAALTALPQSAVGRQSAWYETEPVIDPAVHHAEARPSWFINGVVELTTTLTPRQLLDECLRIEQRIGRHRAAGPVAPLSRPIDLDLLFYGDAVIDDPGLTVPHPRLHLRRFVLTPLAELAPNLIHPTLHATVTELLGRLTDEHAVHRLTPAAATARCRV